MKLIIMGSLFLSVSSYAQSFDLAAYKSLLSQRQATLEGMSVAMSKRVTTLSSNKLEDGTVCESRQLATQSILKIEGAKMLILSQETFSPKSTPACIAAGYQAYKENIIYFQDMPTLASEVSDLDSTASTIKSLTRAGNIVTMNNEVTETNEAGVTLTEAMTLKVDLTKSFFRFLVSAQGPDFTTTSVDMPDLNLATVDLKKVILCDNENGELLNCTEGDYSDFLN